MFSKRLNRLPYACAFLACNAVAIALMLFDSDRVIAQAAVALLVIGVFLWLTVRRLHDLDVSGWFALVILVPVLGTMIALGLCFAKGTEGTNQFGADPMAEEPAILPLG